MSKVYAIIPAGGSGNRINSEIPKQYMAFHGKELIAYTLEIFQKCKAVDEIIISVQQTYFKLLAEIKAKYNFTKIREIVEGGKERQHSVFNALSSIAAHDDDLILVHDAARPLLSQEILENSIEYAFSNDNAVVAIKAKDTLVKGTKTISGYMEREKISYVQTPQIFRYSTLMKAMKKAEEDSFLGTDESMLVSRLGESIHLVEGSSMNFKVTTESDVEVFNLITSKSTKGF